MSGETVWVLEGWTHDGEIARWVLDTLSDAAVQEHLGWLPEGLWSPSASLLRYLAVEFDVTVDPNDFRDLLIGREMRTATR